MDTLKSLAVAHLILLLRPLNEALRLRVRDRAATTARLARPDLSSLCVTNEQVELLLCQVKGLQENQSRSCSIASPVPEDPAALEDLRARARTIGATLPFDWLSNVLTLTEFERQALLICAAPELDQSYERIFSFILDDLNRRIPCTELLIALTSSSLDEQIEKRHALSVFGRLRRFGLLLTTSDSTSDLRREFRLAPMLFEFLTGGTIEPPGWSDRAEVAVPRTPELPPQIAPEAFEHVCAAFREGQLVAYGVWGPRQDGTEELVLSLAAALQQPLRRLLLPEADRSSSEAQRSFYEQLRIAASLGALLWIETDLLLAAGQDRLQDSLSEALACSRSPMVLTGESPWRPVRLLRKGAYAEIDLPVRSPLSRETLWSRRLPELSDDEIRALAARYSLTSADIQCVSDLARIRAQIAGNGIPQPVSEHISAACSLVTEGSSSRYATAVRPTRTPDDLVLPSHLHQQVLEIAAFFILRPRVDEEWGFGRLAQGKGIKVLFTGDPGTGKTLAAEVIAGLLKVPLMKVELARITSKWVGETEKNLEIAFREAEESHAVLFFDEAEALFGRRSEVRHGTDRYANLEVSYLLQKLETCRGLVILASNVKDQIDSAFVRRFQEVIHFPRPAMDERLRIWRLAFSPPAPLESGVDIEVLSHLEMTGAAIVNAARSAAMLAAQEGSSAIGMEHIVRATARQFRREARVLTKSELGRYGALLQGAS